MQLGCDISNEPIVTPSKQPSFRIWREGCYYVNPQERKSQAQHIPERIRFLWKVFLISCIMA